MKILRLDLINYYILRFVDTLKIISSVKNNLAIILYMFLNYDFQNFVKT